MSAADALPPVGGLPTFVRQASSATLYAACRSPKSTFPSLGRSKPLPLRHDRNLASQASRCWLNVPAESAPAAEAAGLPAVALGSADFPQPVNRPARQATAANATRARG